MIKNATANYSSLTNRVTVDINIADLPINCKARLLNQLLLEFGINKCSANTKLEIDEAVEDRMVAAQKGEQS